MTKILVIIASCIVLFELAGCTYKRSGGEDLSDTKSTPLGDCTIYQAVINGVIVTASPNCHVTAK